MCDIVAAKRHAWKQSLSAEDLAKVAAERAEWETNEGKAAKMAEITATFTSADTNGDGFLTGPEMKDFLMKMQ